MDQCPVCGTSPFPPLHLALITLSISCFISFYFILFLFYFYCIFICLLLFCFFFSLVFPLQKHLLIILVELECSVSVLLLPHTINHASVMCQFMVCIPLSLFHFLYLPCYTLSSCFNAQMLNSYISNRNHQNDEANSNGNTSCFPRVMMGREVEIGMLHSTPLSPPLLSSIPSPPLPCPTYICLGRVSADVLISVA